VTRSNRRPLVAAAVAACAVVAAGLLSACGAGKIAQTAQIAPAVPGVSGQASDRAVVVRDAMVDYREPKGYPAGASAPLSLWIVNSTQQAVRLVGVTAALPGGDQNAAAQVVLSNSAAASSAPCVTPRSIAPSAPQSPTSPSPTPVTGPGSSASPSGAKSGASPSLSARSGGSPSAAGSSAPASPSASPSPSPAGATTIDLTIPAGGCVELSRRAAQYLQVVNLPQPLANQNSLMVTFQFQTADGQSFTIGEPPNNAGPLALPVGVPATPGARPSITGEG
jgi:copper(I)-binding protein